MKKIITNDPSKEKVIITNDLSKEKVSVAFEKNSVEITIGTLTFGLPCNMMMNNPEKYIRRTKFNKH